MEKKRISLRKLIFGSINKKLISIIVMIILFNILIWVLAFDSVEDTSRLIEDMQASLLPSIIELSRMGDSINLISRSIDDHLASGEAIHIIRFREGIISMRSILKEYISVEQETLSESEVESVIKEDIDNIEALGNKIITLYKAGSKKEAVDLKRGLFHNAVLHITQEISKEKGKDEKELTESYAAANQEISIYKKNLTAVVFIIFFLIIFLGYFVSRDISRPISKLYHAAHELEKGNLDITIDIDTKGEFKDISDSLNTAVKVLKNTEESRKQLDKAKTEFLSITSHELRSPMTPMRAQLQMLLKGYYGNINRRQRESIEIVLRNTTRLDNIIADFLEISRIEAARLKFNFRKVGLDPYIRSLIEEMQGFMPEKGIKIVLNMGRLPVIESDPDRVMQVLRNLINNAVKFSPEKGSIEVSVKAMKDKLLFSVKDQGIGISQNDQMSIFEPFFQAEQTIYRKHGGTGLGLAICRGIVESQNGKIWVESSIGKGSAFYFTLPYTPVKEMKPIRLLFSPKAGIEKKIHTLFMDMLGPVGDSEFNDFKREHGLAKEKLFKYIETLVELGILDRKKSNDFRKELRIIFTGNK